VWLEVHEDGLRRESLNEPVSGARGGRWFLAVGRLSGVALGIVEYKTRCVRCVFGQAYTLREETRCEEAFLVFSKRQKKVRLEETHRRDDVDEACESYARACA
jgi:hypothetical protein